MTGAQPVDWAALWPAVAVAATCLAVLLIDLWLPARARAVTGGISVLGLLVAFAGVVRLWGEARGTFCVAGVEGGLPSCSYVVNPLTLVFQGIAVLGALVVVLIAAAEVRETPMPAGEFHFLLLASVSGAVVLAAARDLATLVVALEVVSLPAFALVGLRRRDGRSSEAALTFFLVSVVSFAVTLYGVSLVYGATGSLHLDRIAAAFAASENRTAAASLGVVLVLAGFAFKVAAVPFHFWVPDAYTGAPVSVAAYLSVVSKAAGIVGLVVIVTRGFGPYADVWGPVLAVLAAATMTVGNVAALRQRSAVRLLAWSSVAQAGYLLVPLGVGATAAGRGVLGDAMSATVAYLCVYGIVNLGAFAVVAMVGRARPANLLSDYRGMARTEAPSAVALAFFLLCLAGLPPGVIGLFAKVVVFQAAVDGGLGWLAVVMAVNTVIGLAYYLRWVAALFQPPEVAPGARPAEAAGRETAAPVSFSGPFATGVAVGLTLAAAIVLSVVPQLVLQLLPVQGGILG